MRICEVTDLGRTGYAAALELQRDLVERRKRGEVADQLLFVEHPHVVTMGQTGEQTAEHRVECQNSHAPQ